MIIKPLTEELESVWEDFVNTTAETNYYQLLGWKTVFQTVFGFDSHYYLALNEQDEVQGILPMFAMTDVFRRKYLISNPFSNFAGISALNAEAETALLQQAAKVARQIGARYVEFRQLKTQLQGNLAEKSSFVTLMLSLPDSADEIWKSLSSRNRNKIRKAEKNGLTVDFGMDYLEDFHAIYARNLRYLGTPIFPLKMFRAVAAAFPEQAELLVLKLDDKVVSGMFLFKFRGMISEPWVASLREYNKIYVNNFLYWHAIKYACEQGFEVFDFGRSTKDTGTYSFKTQWGAEPVQLYYQYDLNTADSVPVVDAKNNRYQKIIDIWKTLPLSFTNFVGPRVVQYLPEL